MTGRGIAAARKPRTLRRSELLGCAIAMAAACPGMARAADPARYLPPPGAPYGAEEVGVRSGELHYLSGTLTAPRDGKRHVAVVLITDVGAEDRDLAPTPTSAYRPFFQIADTLSRLGIAVLRLDDRGVGASTGSLDTATTWERSLDTRDALVFLRARPDIDKRRIALIGIGEGGAIAAMIAADDSLLAGVVLMAAPGAKGRDLRRATPARDAARDSAGRPARDPWEEFFATYDPLAAARRVRVPALLMNGALDEIVPASDMEALASAARGGGNHAVTTKAFEGLGHDFLPVHPDTGSAGADASGRIPREVTGAIANWLVRTLDPAAQPKLPPAPAHRSRHRHSH